MQERHEEGPAFPAVASGRSTRQRSEPDLRSSGEKGLVGGRRLLLAVLTWIAMSAAVGVSLWTGLDALAPSWGGADGPVLAIVAEVYLALVVALLLAFGGAAGLRDRLRLRYTSARDLRLALVVWVVCWVAIALVYFALTPILGPPKDALLQLLRFGSDMSRLPAAGPIMLVLIVARACLLAPLAEELLFRGALFGWARRYLPALPTILLTAALFAGIHMMPLLLPVAFLFGVAAGWVRERTGSTLPFFVAHVLNNAVMLAVASALAAGGLTL